MAGIFKKLRDRVFGRNPAPEAEASTPSLVTLPPLQKEKSSGTKNDGRRSSSPEYFVQIGLDFGTAFSKCVCRDVMTGSKAWVHRRPKDKCISGLPFLIPSVVHYQNGVFTHQPGYGTEYSKHGLPHVKMALEKVSLSQWDDPVLEPFRRAAGSNLSDHDLVEFIEASAVYLLAGIIGEVKAAIPSYFPAGFVEGRVAVNMAVPVSNADHPDVENTFQRVLCQAWVIANELQGFPSISITDLKQKISATKGQACSSETNGACYIYPEVSANVQAFVRSRTSREGIYLFSDTGAGTVDQSLFIFTRNSGESERSEKLTYLYAAVLPLGSSHLERLAAEHAGTNDWKSLESYRKMKEQSKRDVHLCYAVSVVRSELSDSTQKTIYQAKQKLQRRQQIDDLRILFGGGGHITDPYAEAVEAQFSGRYFNPITINMRRSKGESFAVGMPDPQDLELAASERKWMKRLTVAYGLSFEKSELSPFKLPKAVSDPKPEDLWQPKREFVAAPSKDVC